MITDLNPPSGSEHSGSSAPLVTVQALLQCKTNPKHLQKCFGFILHLGKPRQKHLQKCFTLWEVTRISQCDDKLMGVNGRSHSSINPIPIFSAKHWTMTSRRSYPDCEELDGRHWQLVRQRTIRTTVAIHRQTQPQLTHHHHQQHYHYYPSSLLSNSSLPYIRWCGNSCQN